MNLTLLIRHVLTVVFDNFYILERSEFDFLLFEEYFFNLIKEVICKYNF